MSRTANRLQTAWDAIRTSLWPVPGAMLVLGAALAPAMLALESRFVPGDGARGGWLTAGTGEDASLILSTLLTSVIAMASMVFSVTVVALSLAANSYGPRLIRTFRADFGTQLTLGMFVMTIVYLLLTLRAIRAEMTFAEVPHLSVTVASVLSFGCVLALLAFIQSVSKLIVADEVVRRVETELDHSIATLSRARDDAVAAGSLELPPEFERTAAHLRLPREGYVQAVAMDEMVAWAAARGAILRLDFRAGDFVVEGDRKVQVWPPPPDEEEARTEIGRFIVSGQERTPTQDLEFAVRHLVEVAVRALSPGINDPFTAMAVIDRLRGGLCRLAACPLPGKCVTDEHGRLRIVRCVTTYGGVLDAALNQIRQAGSAKPDILIHMLEALGNIAEHARAGDQLAGLERHARLLLGAGRRDVSEPADQADITRAFDATLRAIERASAVIGQRAAR